MLAVRMKPLLSNFEATTFRITLPLSAALRRGVRAEPRVGVQLNHLGGVTQTFVSSLFIVSDGMASRWWLGWTKYCAALMGTVVRPDGRPQSRFGEWTTTRF